MERAVANGDRLGGLIFSEHEHVELRPRLGRRAALRLFQAISQDSMWETTETAAQGDEPAHAEHTLARLTRVARPGSVIFLLSDFRNLGERFERNLRQLAGHCDVFLVHLFDTVEV